MGKNKETRTIAISLKNWKKLSKLKIKQALRGFDETISYMFEAVKGGLGK